MIPNISPASMDRDTSCTACTCCRPFPKSFEICVNSTKSKPPCIQKSGKLKCSPLPMCNTSCMSLYGKTPFTKNTFDPVRSGKAANEHAKMWASAWPCPYTYRSSFEIPDKSYSPLLSTCLPSWLVYILSLYRRLVNGFLKVFLESALCTIFLSFLPKNGFIPP